MFDIIRKERLDSTNSYALELLNKGTITSPTVIVCKEQYKGRGQATNTWFSEPNKSLTFSIVLFPKHISLERQFCISQAINIAIYNTFSEYCKQVSIKWPNDIFIANKKACGILIENAISTDHFSYCICGIGINVNNLNFPSDFSATSLKLEQSRVLSIDEILDNITKNIEKFYTIAEEQNYECLTKLYHEHLLGKDKWLEYEDSNGVFSGKIKGVNNFGQLEIEDLNNKLRTYGFKEVSLKTNLL